MTITHMKQEALECAAVSQRILDQAWPQIMHEASQWTAAGLQYVEVLGRGSSSHAGTVLRYALSEYSALMVGAAMPITAGQYCDPVKHPNSLVIAISQSGKSPDLLRYAALRKAQSSRVVAIVNNEDSELAHLAHTCLGMRAGPELSVAATKSSVASTMVGLGLVCGIHPETSANLREGLQALPTLLAQSAQNCNWAALAHALPEARAVYIVGRGATLGVAKELALKITETTGIPALAYSSAEFLHGPLGAIDSRTPVIGLCSDPALEESVTTALLRAKQRGAVCLSAFSHKASDLPVPQWHEKYSAALSMLPCAYLAIEAAALSMGRNPDRPEGLAKVTQTQ